MKANPFDIECCLIIDRVVSDFNANFDYEVDKCRDYSGKYNVVKIWITCSQPYKKCQSPQNLLYPAQNVWEYFWMGDLDPWNQILLSKILPLTILNCSRITAIHGKYIYY